MAVFSVVINQNITMQKPIPTFKHPTVGSPAGHTLNWECPTLLEATPGAHHRGCLARDGWEGLDATGNFWHCQIQIWSLPHCCKFLIFFLNIAFPAFISEVFWSFWLQAASLPKKQFGTNVLWALLGIPATHPLMVLLLPWQVEHPGSLPWAGWARTPCSCNFLWTLTL